MLNDNIDTLIKESMLKKDKFRTDVLRLIKTKFTEYKTARDAKPLDESTEINILKKMVLQRKDSAEQYLSGGNKQLADNELAESELIKEFLPEEVTEKQIESAIDEAIISGYNPEKKNMGNIIRFVKAKYPMADGKLTSQLVARRLS